MKDIELATLVSRLKESDRHAFERLFNLYHENIYRFLLFKVKDAPLAEDLLQDVFLKMWNARATLDERQSVKNYLYTIADNIVLNHVRHLKVVSKHQEQNEIKIFTHADSPDYILEEKEWNLRLKKAIEDLPEKTRVIFLMSRVEDLTYREISDRLSVSTKTVEGHIVKALKILQEGLSVKL
jgi:RNA polymerase sigma-70 factor (family 1)